MDFSNITKIQLIDFPVAPKLSSSEMIERLKEIKVLSIDMDGVLTDGGIYESDQDFQMRKFFARDGMGLAQMPYHTDVSIALITASGNRLINNRVSRLNIKYSYLGCGDKEFAIKDIARKENIDFKQICHIGDDVNDLPVYKHCGLKITVADGDENIKSIVDYVTKKGGGKGAVREICDLIMLSRGASYDGYGLPRK